ncbi:MAG: HAD-IA family hydrolase [Candidatus Caenarcaniphilales bacterium]|nr:HAD-IA family hydrolase [Candidatus Caenarcaniphilales bacterium]
MSIDFKWPGGSHPNCELIIFDKDGTLIDFKSVWLNMAAARAQRLADSLSSNSAELFNWRNRFLRALGINPETGDISLDGPIVNLSFESQSYCLATLLHSLEPDLYTWKKALELTNESIDWALKQNDPATMSSEIPGAFDFIKQLSKCSVKLALITSDSTENANKTLVRFGVRECFQAVVGSDTQFPKPSSRAIISVCKSLGVDINRAIMIGDAPNDIKMAKGANIPVICVEGLASRVELLEHGADAVVDSLDDLEFQSQKEVAKKLILRTDGASRGNPGQASIGYVISDSQENSVHRYGRPIGSQTNNYAEYTALIYGLEKVVSMQPESLTIELDSDLIVKQVQKKYRVKDQTLIQLYKKVERLLLDLNCNWDIKHIPRADNHEADALCNKALNFNREVN